MVLIFALNGNATSHNTAKGKQQADRFHPDRQSPRHAPVNAKKAAGFFLPPHKVKTVILY